MIRLKKLMFFACLFSSINFIYGQTEQLPRTALVIGNSNYSDSPLKNPANDAKVISETLRELNFNVTTLVDASKEQMTRAIRDFGNALEEDPGVGLFYYAGHGIQSDGVNYLIPLEAEIEQKFELEFECVKADRALAVMEYYENPFNIVILDACRNNPFRSFVRSGERGLAPPAVQPTGSIVAFATQPGKTASDGSGNNGLYTEELVKAMKLPNMSIEDVFKEVRINVAKISGEDQIPQEWSSLMGQFYFNQQQEEEKAVSTAAAIPPKPQVTIGQSQYLVGDFELTVLFDGDLYLDEELMGEVEQGVLVPVMGVSVGKHNIRVVGEDHTWEKEITVLKEETATFTTDVPPVKEMEAKPLPHETLVDSQLSSISENSEKEEKQKEIAVPEIRIYDVVDTQAEYKPGLGSLYSLVAKDLALPRGVRKSDLERSRMYVSFVVDQEGNLSDIRIVKEGEYGWAANHVIRALRSTSGDWIPSKLGGESVRQRKTIPLQFTFK